MQALVTGVVEEGNPLGSGHGNGVGDGWGAGGSKGGGEEKLPDADGVLPQA